MAAMSESHPQNNWRSTFISTTATARCWTLGVKTIRAWASPSSSVPFGFWGRSCQIRPMFLTASSSGSCAILKTSASDLQQVPFPEYRNDRIISFSARWFPLERDSLLKPSCPTDLCWEQRLVHDLCKTRETLSYFPSSLDFAS